MASNTSTAAPSRRYKLVFFVPVADSAACKTAVLAAGAGQFPNYSEVCFETLGTNQFRPGEASTPYIGQPGRLEEVAEARIETVVTGEETMRDVVRALKQTHPYEVPVYEVYKLEDF
ncbi:GTP cyclohydrolase 1 type 2/Nif3 [Microdochium trichocladiopsis]|uniref:ATP phosphoribosyltransferase n=1 Tax=Microdochium trichocladiopsis TaxID=1682393 RepID=A0A9P8Y1F4_9PEZI|nr:GTP cyclohydrolase 1 type 2/Nif3 [Microdochium trichocladiopsis]KAH7026721.1 GTP cyclohydrolase 1 type 2/Nif3 [Microdochium trichocladiopsis]